MKKGSKLFCKMLKMSIPDEHSARPEYKKIGKLSNNKAERKIFNHIASQEGNHEKIDRKIYNERCK